MARGAYKRKQGIHGGKHMDRTVDASIDSDIAIARKVKDDRPKQRDDETPLQFKRRLSAWKEDRSVEIETKRRATDSWVHETEKFVDKPSSVFDVQIPKNWDVGARRVRAELYKAYVAGNTKPIDPVHAPVFFSYCETAAWLLKNPLGNISATVKGQKGKAIILNPVIRSITNMQRHASALSKTLGLHKPPKKVKKKQEDEQKLKEFEDAHEVESADDDEGLFPFNERS